MVAGVGLLLLSVDGSQYRWTRFWLQGNYDSYVNTKMELMENQAKRYKWEQDQIAHMKVSLSLSVVVCICWPRVCRDGLPRYPATLLVCLAVSSIVTSIQ